MRRLESEKRENYSSMSNIMYKLHFKDSKELIDSSVNEEQHRKLK